MATNFLEKGLRVGLIGESITTVTSEKTALAVGSGALDIFATPAMAAEMESAAVSAVDPYLPDGMSSVGIEFSVRHLSATPIGERIVSMAEITRIDGRRVIIEVRCWDERELIGDGKHVRYVIETDEFLERTARDHS